MLSRGTCLSGQYTCRKANDVSLGTKERHLWLRLGLEPVPSDMLCLPEKSIIDDSTLRKLVNRVKLVKQKAVNAYIRVSLKHVYL